MITLLLEAGDNKAPALLLASCLVATDIVTRAHARSGVISIVSRQGGWDKVRAHVVQLTFHRYSAQ